MATSTIPAFKAALLTRLQADAGLTGVDLSYGVPFPRTPDREWVWLGNAEGEQETAAMGQRRREETWVQEIVVSCIKPARESQQTLTERAFAITAVIEDSLRTWSALPGPVFGGVVRQALVIGTQLEELADESEREARVTIRVACANRI